MMNVESLTESNVDTAEKQAKALKRLDHKLTVADQKHLDVPKQTIANDVATIAESDHGTTISNAVLDSLREYYVSNVALWYEEAWNHVHYNDSNKTDQHVLPELKAKMQFCKEHHIDPNNFWVTTDEHNNIQPVDVGTLTLVIRSVNA